MIKRDTISNALIAVFALTLVGCGGGGSSISAYNSTFTSYTASASVGEKLTVIINTTAMSYSYTITKSDYGCDVPSATCHSGNGTLVQNVDGSYSSTDTYVAGGGVTKPKFNFLVKPDGFIAGIILLNLPSGSVYAPIIGLSNPIANSVTLANGGTPYNRAMLSCTTPSSGSVTTQNCATGYGTTVITSVTPTTATYSDCANGNVLATPPVACSSTATGTLTYSNGSWIDQNGDSLVAYVSASGQLVGFKDLGSTGGGHGQSILMSPITTTPLGTYWLANIGQYFSGTWAFTSTTYSYTTGAGSTLPPSAIAYNTPWNGMFQVGLGVGMISTDGLVVLAGGAAQYLFGY